MNILATQKTTFKSSTKTNQWIKWNWSEDMDPKIVMTRAVITWVMLLLLYTCFQFSWQIVNQANNSQGPVYQLWPSSASDPMVSRISNWSVTITRGIVAIGLGLLVTKIGHKNAVIFAVSMVLLSFPALLTPFIKSSLTDNNVSEVTSSKISYVLFIIFRIFLAIGGTAINILQAPLIAKFFVTTKQRNMTVKINNVPAQVAGILASVIFIKGVANELAGSVENMSKNWQLISGVVLGIVLVILIAYLFIGMHFKLKTNDSVKKTELSQADKKQGSLFTILKQPKVIFFTLGLIFLMYAGIEPGSGVLSNFLKTTQNNIHITWNPLTGVPTGSATASDAMLIWQILYTISIFIALFTVMKWSNTKYSISRYCGILTCVGCAFWGLSFGLGAINLGNNTAKTFFYLTGIIGSTFIFGAQSMMYIVPYKWGLSNAQLTSYVGFLWTAMYVGYSLLDIMTSFAGSISVSNNLGTIADYIANHTSYYDSATNGIFNAASGILKDPKVMSDNYGKIKDFLLGTNVDLLNLSQYKYNGLEVFNTNVIQNILNTNTLQQSVSNLSNQYTSVAILLPIVPFIGGIFLFFVKKEEFELVFSFKHFRENHLHFSKTKNLINKVLKTNLEIKVNE